MKRILLAILLTAILAMSLACAKTTSDGLGLPNATQGTVMAAVGTDNAPTAVTNDETTSGTYEDGQDNAVNIPNITTSYSYLAKNWMHANLPTWGSQFKTWMTNNGYNDVATMSGPDSSGNPGFGGFQSGATPSYNSTSKKIVVLIHGNGSKAQGAASDQRGWFDTYKMLRDNGWNNSQIFAVNFLDSTSVMNAANNDHRTTHVNRVRRFLEAVYAYVNAHRASGYTTAVKLTVVAHSLGCTATRAAMRDGNLYSKVETFISISGGNNGLLSCGSYTGSGLVWGYYPYAGTIAPTCSSSTGLALPVPYKLELWYGVYYIWGPSDMSEMVLNDSLTATKTNLGYYSSRWGWVTGFYNTSALTNSSYFLGVLNNADRQFKYGTSTATRAYVILSEVDEIVGIKSSGVYGQRWWSAKLHGAYGTAQYTSIPYGHFGNKSRTTAVQKNMILRTYSGTKTNPTS